MRDILFRAKRIDNSEWVEGYYQEYPKGYVHIQNSSNDCFSVYPNTVCQYTELTDKNGNKIWENDIIYNPAEDEYFTIVWSDDGGCWEMHTDNYIVDFSHHYWSYDIEVVGNIFDNK